MEAYKLYITNKEDQDGFYGITLIVPVDKLFTVLSVAFTGNNKVEILEKVGGDD